MCSAIQLPVITMGIELMIWLFYYVEKGIDFPLFHDGQSDIRIETDQGIVWIKKWKRVMQLETNLANKRCIIFSSRTSTLKQIHFIFITLTII